MASMTSYNDGRLVVWGGDCLDLMAALAPDSIDAIVTDPPYGLGFMGKKWDDLPPGKEWAEACYRVLKPGGHLLAFGGTRTWHRLAVAIEDGGFEIRDSLAWLYGSGFPKSMDVSKAIDKAAGAEREVTGLNRHATKRTGHGKEGVLSSRGPGLGGIQSAQVTAPATPEAQQWEGWGTALKPAFEPIVVGRKTLAEKTVAANVLTHGTGALNVDGCRIETTDKLGGGHSSKGQQMDQGWHRPWMDDPEAVEANAARSRASVAKSEELGRWPANVVLDESQAEALDRQAEPTKSRKGKPRGSAAPGEGWGMTATGAEYDDAGGPSRFFYVAKAPKSERPVVELTGPDGTVTKVAHPTVKPVALMRWLVRLVTPPDGLVLDTFAGTGTTGEACVLEGFRCLLAEDPTKGEQDYLPLIDQRITRAVAQLPAKAEETVA